MIHVGMGKENQVYAGEFVGGQGRGHEPFAAHGGKAEVGTDFCAESRISKDIDAEKIDEDGSVAKP